MLDPNRPHGTERLPNGRYKAWINGESSEHETQHGAESWVRRRKNEAFRLDRDDYAMSLAEIGKILGISTVRVRQLELQAVGKFRAALANDPEFKFWFDL